MTPLFWLFLLAGTGEDEKKSAAREVFERRILPIFKSPDPSSCAECHLAGVDLKNYILPSHEKTFLSLRDQGLVDLEKPEESKILRLIKMGEEEKGSALISDKARKAEYEAFAEWIKASAADPKLREAPKVKELARPKRPDEVIRHARADRVLESFERHVWSQRLRCFGCHSAQGGQNAKLVKENGPGMTWMKRTAEETLSFLRESELISPKAPEKSLLLMKPTNQVKHGGGQKMLVGDMAYKGFRTWIEDYAKVLGDKYAQASDLPKNGGGLESFGTEAWLKITNTPPAWADRLLQANVYAWNERKKAWEPDPVATSDRRVFGKGKLWQHQVWALAAPGSDRAKAWRDGRPGLAPGRYLVRVYVDFQGKLERDWRAVLGKADVAGEAEIEARWTEGYGSMTVVDAGQFRR